MKVTGIVLAAGMSTRMGAPKPLLPFGNSTVIGTILEVLSRAGLADLMVVTGPLAEEIESAVRPWNPRLVNNPDHASGMLSSVRAGLRQVASDCAAVAILPVDQPRLKAETIRTLIACYAQHHPGALVVPEHHGKRGHPLLMDAAYIPEVLAKFDPVGLRGLLQEQSARLVSCPSDDDAVVSNMNTWPDYERERKLAERP